MILLKLVLYVLSKKEEEESKEKWYLSRSFSPSSSSGLPKSDFETRLTKYYK